MKQLSLDVLRTFVSIADLGSFQKAGDVIGRTQPAISLQMKRLEEQLSRKLFVKQGQRYLLNNDGQWLYEQARSMLALNDEIFRNLGENRLKGRMRLGIPSEFASTLLPSIIGEFSQRYPDVALEVTSALTKHLLDHSVRESFDLILALQPSDKSLIGEVVLEDKLVWVGDPNNRLPLDSIPLVVAPEGCVYRTRIIQALKQQTHAWKITFTNADLYGLVAAIRQGLGVTALARSSVPPELSVIRDKRLPTLGKVNICLLDQDALHPQISQTLIQFIKARLQNY